MVPAGATHWLWNSRTSALGDAHEKVRCAPLGLLVGVERLGAPQRQRAHHLGGRSVGSDDPARADYRALGARDGSADRL
jgi:hypothetical protein